MEGDAEPLLAHEPLSIQFRLLYNWAQGMDQDPLLQHKVSMYAAFEVILNHIPIYRLIDATLTSSNEHWVSAGQLWKACGLTLMEGLFLFELASSQYQLDFLQSSFPFTDVWVPLGLARTMAKTLDVMDDLVWFLNGPLLDNVNSTDDAHRQEMVHNWRIVGIPNTLYSTQALLDYVLVAGEPLIVNSNTTNDEPQTTTLMTRHQYQPGIVMKDRAETGLVRWQVWAYEHFLISQRGDKQRYSLNDDDDPVPVTALWDVVQGLLCDLQSLERRQQQQPDVQDDECKRLKASRVFSDSMVLGNMPLKSGFLRQSPALQHIYLSVMMEKLYNAMGELSQTTMKKHELDLLIASSIPPPPPKGHTATPTSPSVSTTTQSEQTTTSKGRHQKQRPRSLVSRRDPPPLPTMDPNMMLHDRMDLLEQEMYRVKKKAKRKMDESDLKWMELQHQLMTLDTWKRNLESRRKNERAWMLLIILLLSLVLWVFS